MLVRSMCLADIDRVMDIAEGLKDAPRWRRETYQAAVEPGLPERIALVAVDAAGNVNGFAVAVLIPPQAELETIAVVSETQRKGIASRIFEELRAGLKRMQITEVMLEVRESNHAARALYARLGFVENGRRHGYYSDPQEDAVLLQRLV